jgi:hypothetical protein
MQEPYGEGLASHTDPESCVVSREVGQEALTGARPFAQWQVGLPHRRYRVTKVPRTISAKEGRLEARTSRCTNKFLVELPAFVMLTSSYWSEKQSMRFIHVVFAIQMRHYHQLGEACGIAGLDRLDQEGQPNSGPKIA